jgi:glucose-1-phosphate cytidylyltransferase
MHVGILAGGMGSRLSEETEIRPKPMVEIGGKPILWHIMKYYASFGFTDFSIALGYKGDVIRNYFRDAAIAGRTMSINTGSGAVELEGDPVDAWNVKLVETGLTTDTGGRIKRLQPHLGTSTFMLTWGDGVSDVDLQQLLAFHRSHGKLATLTAVRPPARFGRLDIAEGGAIRDFAEKPEAGEFWINGAFFVLEPQVFDYIDGDDTSWERGPMVRLAHDNQLMAYEHRGFWQCMDTINDRQTLEKLWAPGNAPWKRWKQ